MHFLYVASRSLWVPIAVHLLNNSLAVLLAVKAVPGEQIEAAFADRPVWLAVVGVGLLVSAGFALWTARGRVVLAQDLSPTELNPGMMVPPPGIGTIAHHPPHWLPTVLAVGFCVGLVTLVLV